VFLGNYSSVPLRLPSPFLLCFSARCAAAALAGHVQRPRRLRATLSHATRPPLLCRCLPDPALAAPAFPMLRRRRPSRHDSRWHASSCSHATTSSSRPRAHPGAPCALALAFAHTHFAHFPLLRPPHFTGPPPRPQLTIDSRHRCSPSPIQSTNSTTSSPRSDPAPPSPPSDTPACRTPCRHCRQ
jgi:hypothetical protein